MKPLPCIICGFKPKLAVPADIDTCGQPANAVMCVAYGNYGSKEWDNLFGKIKHFNICDKCFVKKEESHMREDDAWKKSK